MKSKRNRIKMKNKQENDEKESLPFLDAFDSIKEKVNASSYPPHFSYCPLMHKSDKSKARCPALRMPDTFPMAVRLYVTAPASALGVLRWASSPACVPTLLFLGR